MSKTKAQTLEWVRGKLELFDIPDFIYFDKSEWTQNKNQLIDSIVSQFNRRKLAVRSSASDEDGVSNSLAGEYESVLNVASNDSNAIESAVEEVFSSYQKNGERFGKDEVIVQRMIENTSMSGVIFTHDLNTGAPYYVINYDDVSGKTDTVTSGDGNYANRTLYIHRGAAKALRSERFQQLIHAVQELEKVMDSQFLDIEFAVNNDLQPILFQVRAITTQPNWNRAVSKRIDASLRGIQQFVSNRFKPMKGVYGKTTVLGQMPDWNPAEMIGRAPRNLAYSLYETLITKDAWRIARERMKYAVPSGQPLMVSLSGQPYIDTRLSFHSYLPADLSPEISNKLVDVWVKNLKENPQLHDKIEFDVAITIYSFDIDKKINELTDGVLNENEIGQFKLALHRLTVDLVNGNNNGGIDSALKEIEKLRQKQRRVTEYDYEELELTILHNMIDDCIRYGTIPFSILARHGFIARTLMLSLKQRGFFTSEEINQIQSSIQTIAGDLVDDMFRLQTNEIRRDDFMEKYGHLRPGTYDILSLRYDQIEDFGTGDHQVHSQQEHKKFELDEQRRKDLDQLLEDEGFKGVDSDTLLEYIGKATAGREYGKFIFTRTVSNMLEIIAKFAERNGLSREEISHVQIQDILSIANESGEGSIEDRLRAKSEEGQESHNVSSAIRLPQVLFDEEGVHVVPFQVSHPNFITDKRIDAESISLSANDSPPDIDGKIVLIESADPGFDWIFAHNIAGLITKYGGANSHMAIRCAEFSIPAAIGCGEQKYDVCKKARKISLDCTTGLIQTQF
jgi:phosphohistidine swiveling domain-containing protein